MSPLCDWDIQIVKEQSVLRGAFYFPRIIPVFIRPGRLLRGRPACSLLMN